MTAGACPDHGRPAVCPIALALEGGGSLGAFTWGVLDRILDAIGIRSSLDLSLFAGVTRDTSAGTRAAQHAATAPPADTSTERLTQCDLTKSAATYS